MIDLTRKYATRAGVPVTLDRIFEHSERIYTVHGVVHYLCGRYGIQSVKATWTNNGSFVRGLIGNMDLVEVAP